MTEENRCATAVILLWPALVMMLLALSAIAPVQVDAQSDGRSGSMNRSPPSLVEAGAEAFADHCSVCHGATGLGLAEAREAFPADHRRCQRCHKPGNPPTMNLAQVEQRQHDLFDVGDPPPLKGSVSLAALADPQALRRYIEAAMPRYRPGALSGQEYEALTAFLLQINDRR